jgi:hypothetical protein
VLISFAFAYGAALLLLGGTLLLILHSRRRLYNVLQAYRERKGLPRNITRKKTFLRRLKQEQK